MRFQTAAASHNFKDFERLLSYLAKRKPSNETNLHEATVRKICLHSDKIGNETVESTNCRKLGTYTANAALFGGGCLNDETDENSSSYY